MNGLLTISSACIGVVVTFRCDVLVKLSGASKSSSSGSRVLRFTFV